jgi:two-component system, cell cycle sensor histidine kinase and response regulator CckA
MESVRATHETARLRLARYQAEGTEARQRGAAHAVRVSASALSVERVGLWLLRDDDRQLWCMSQYARSLGTYSSGQILHASVYPTYVRGLAERRILAAHDAKTDPLTRELDATYLTPNGVTSMLDAPIIRKGRVVGVVCHEHVGPKRIWQQGDLDFASSVADMIALIFEQSERLELEALLQTQVEERQEAHKMEALGRMACSVAHDFNNLLGAVGLSVSALGKTLDDRAGAASVIAAISDAIGAGRRLTQQLVDFGKPGLPRDGGLTDLAALLQDRRPMLQLAIGSQIELALEITARRAMVSVAPSQLEQILLNLSLNARDAQGGTGRITIALRDALPDDQAGPDSIVIEVRDSGVGMDEATRDQIFEPFFTTKPHGTGLGLATVHGIAMRAGGSAQALSEPGIGTTIRIALPSAAPAGAVIEHTS